MLTIPKGIEKKPIPYVQAPADAVNTVSITASVAALVNTPTINVLRAFAQSHMDLGIVLRYDTVKGLPWVTPAEAEAMRGHMMDLLTAEGLDLR